MSAAATATITSTSTRARAISLYRQLMRGARKMPTPNRMNFVIKKTRMQYRANLELIDPEEIDFELRLGETNLDTVLVQAEHLGALYRDPGYQGEGRHPILGAKPSCGS